MIRFYLGMVENLAGYAAMLVVSLIAYSHLPAVPFWQSFFWIGFAKLVLGGAVFHAAWEMFEYLLRTFRVLRCQVQPSFMRRMVCDLDSGAPITKCHALQIIADIEGHPFGFIRSGPILHPSEDIDQMARLYKERLAKKKRLQGELHVGQQNACDSLVD